MTLADLDALTIGWIEANDEASGEPEPPDAETVRRNLERLRRTAAATH